ncbi:MAG: hypothetical protein Q9181_001194 [Wetmoreana brouardii]
MVQTRKQRQEEDDRRAQEEAQRNQHINQNETGQGSRQVSQRGNAQNGRTGPESRNQTSHGSTRGPGRPRSRRIPRDPRINSERPRRHGLPQRTGSGVRKPRLVQWHGITLPNFTTPKWRIRGGVPTLVLRAVDLEADADAARNNRAAVEDIREDSQSDHTIPDIGNQGSEEKGKKQSAVSVSSERVDQDLPQYYHPAGEKTDVVKNKLPIVGIPMENDLQRWGNRFSNFIRSPFGLVDRKTKQFEQGWKGRKPLGRGTFGMAGMWEKELEDGSLDVGTLHSRVGRFSAKDIQQVVVKQIGPSEKQPWNPTKPMEATVLFNINLLPNPTGCVGYRGYQCYDQRQAHRIYMEYCPNGDLHKLIKKYRTKRRLLPEAFIWDVFYNLALACQSLATTCCIRGHVGCSEFVHLDIKPANVFLTEKGDWDEGTNILYATAKLGDFGLTVCTGHNDDGNPNHYKGGGTPHYKALEQESLYTKDPKRRRKIRNLDAAKRRYEYLRDEEYDGEDPKLGAPTNVWGVGAVIFELMTFKQVAHYLYRPATTFDSLEALPTIECHKIINHSKHKYSRRLMKLVKECLRPNPRTRPPVAELVERTQVGRSTDYDYLRHSYRVGNPDFEKYKMPFSDLDDMSEKSDWESSRGQRYTDAAAPTISSSKSEKEKSIKKENEVSKKGDDNKGAKKKKKKRKGVKNTLGGLHTEEESSEDSDEEETEEEDTYDSDEAIDSSAS